MIILSVLTMTFLRVDLKEFDRGVEDVGWLVLDVHGGSYRL